MLRIGIAPCTEGMLQMEGMPPWLARLLHARGIRTEEEARNFLNPGMDQIASPGLLPGMEKALQLLHEAKKQGKKVAVYGDYDVDGVCASAILKEAFTLFGLSCKVYIPHRHEEGYGLNIPAVEKLAEDCQLLVTVDCGITSIEEVEAAKKAGMQVIVTDHHKPSEELPAADAVISPLLSGYPFPYLCGAGVAWKLAWGLLGERAECLMELAALATIADMVPLTGENRSIVFLGLKQLSRTKRPGLRAVMENAGLKGPLTSEQAAFQIAPRMNACGRMESAGIALDMLLTVNKNEAEALAAKMERLNQERKNQEAYVVGEALAQVEKLDLIAVRGLVVTGENWNSGVVGLAAGKVAEKYTCPTVVLSREGDVCVGSARSAGDVDVHKALSQCADLFIRFGGHRQAAGLTLEYANVPEFARRFSQAVQEQTGDRALVPQLLCDGEMNLADVTEETVALLSRLEPFGMGNPAPRFLCEGAKALSLRPVGSQGKHLKCTFQQGDALRDGIFFGGGDWAGSDGASFRMVMTPVINEFRGQIHAECQLQALQLLPERILHQPARETAAFLSEEMDRETADEITLRELSGLMQGNQGTLLVCRCLKTALEMHKLFPDADFALEKALNPKAYHTILLYGRAENTCASYRYVVLCDGSLGDASAYKAACPEAKIYALPVSAEMRGLLSGMYVDVLKLRECYRQMKEEPCRDLPAWARLFGLKEEQAAFVLKVFAMMGLAEVSFYPFHSALRPMIKCNPEDNPLFRLARHAKEEQDGVYSL